MDKQLLVDVATLSANLAVIEYALAHIEARFVSGDTKNLRTAVKLCQTVVNKWLEESTKDAEMDKRTERTRTIPVKNRRRISATR